MQVRRRPVPTQGLSPTARALQGNLSLAILPVRDLLEVSWALLGSKSLWGTPFCPSCPCWFPVQGLPRGLLQFLARSSLL